MTMIEYVVARTLAQRDAEAADETAGDMVNVREGAAQIKRLRRTVEAYEQAEAIRESMERVFGLGGGGA